MTDMVSVEKFLELVDVYEDIAEERSLVYFLQDSDNINKLEDKKNALLGELGVYWVDGKPRILQRGNDEAEEHQGS